MSRFQPIQGRPIKFALVGCGRISANHIEALKGFSDYAKLTDVCDIDPEALRKATEKTGARGFDSLEKLLAESDADIVSLCTPSGMHSHQGMAVAKAGKHVLTEKPMATSLEDANRLVRACDDANVRLFVVKQNRQNSTLQLLKSVIEQGRFGKIYMVNVNVFWCRPQSYYDQAKWRGTWEMDGGAFMNQASHYVDLLSWLIGEVESLQAYTATLARRIEAEDTGVVSLKWRSGALGSFNVTMLTYPENLEGSITIIGENGTVRVGGVAVNEIQYWKFRDRQPQDEKILSASYETTSVYGRGHVPYYDNVIKALRGEAEPYTDGRSGLKSLELLIAIYLSARGGSRIALPLRIT